jgi:hypothetical protein
MLLKKELLDFNKLDVLGLTLEFINNETYS